MATTTNALLARAWTLVGSLALISITLWVGYQKRQDLGQMEPEGWGVDEIMRAEPRFAAVRAALPKASTVGYLSDAEGMKAIGLAAIKEYIIAQYAMIPHALLDYRSFPLVLVDTRGSDPSRLIAQLPKEDRFVLLRDFGDQLLLLGRTR